MAEFHAAVTTNQGVALVADLLAGEQIEFTKLVTGSGVYGNEEIERTTLQKVSALREQRQEFGFSSISKVSDACVLLKTLLSNVTLTQGYRMTEIGVYAKKPGDEGDGILYSISVAKEADFFPHYNGLVAVEIIEEYYITVSDTAAVSIKTGSGAAVLLEDFEKFKAEIDKHIDELIKGLYAKLQEKISEIKKLFDKLKPFCLKDADGPFVLMTEATYKPLSERTKGCAYGLITRKRGLISVAFDRYVTGREDPAVEKTGYGIEATERAGLEMDTRPYVAVFSNVVRIEEGQEIERQPGMIYAVVKNTRRKI